MLIPGRVGLEINAMSICPMNNTFLILFFKIYVIAALILDIIVLDIILSFTKENHGKYLFVLDFVGSDNSYNSIWIYLISYFLFYYSYEKRTSSIWNLQT